MVLPTQSSFPLSALLTIEAIDSAVGLPSSSTALRKLFLPYLTIDDKYAAAATSPDESSLDLFLASALRLRS